MSTLSEARAVCDAIREREKEKDKAYVKLEAKCNDAFQDLEKNPLVLDLRAEIETLQGQVEKLHDEYSRLVLQEIDGLKQDKAMVVAKVVSYVAMKLVHSDEMGFLVSWLDKTAIIHEATADPYAPLEVLLSKKPKSLCAKSALSQSKSKPLSLKTINPDN
ncbi:hypothetical protein Tco_0080880 [Tanacetum coccineum]